LSAPVVTRDHVVDRSLSSEDPVINLVGVNKWFGSYHVLRDVNLRIARGERVVLWGPSGSGKTTLLRCLAGLEPAQTGVVQIAGTRKPVGALATSTTTPGVALVFQQSALFLNLRVIENLTIGLRHVRKMAPRQAEALAMEKLERLGLANVAVRYPRQLSGGQRQRAEIARALCMEPAVLLFDEPTAALDPELKSDVATMIANLARDGHTIVVATHELAVVHALAPRVIRMSGGRVIGEMRPDEFARTLLNDAS
jgi:ABC-type polar amino acid transport system ATPase subunit